MCSKVSILYTFDVDIRFDRWAIYICLPYIHWMIWPSPAFVIESVEFACLWEVQVQKLPPFWLNEEPVSASTHPFIFCYCYLLQRVQKRAFAYAMSEIITSLWILCLISSQRLLEFGGLCICCNLFNDSSEQRGCFFHSLWLVRIASSLILDFMYSFFSFCFSSFPFRFQI